MPRSSLENVPFVSLDLSSGPDTLTTRFGTFERIPDGSNHKALLRYKLVGEQVPDIFLSLCHDQAADDDDLIIGTNSKPTGLQKDMMFGIDTLRHENLVVKAIESLWVTAGNG